MPPCHSCPVCYKRLCIQSNSGRKTQSQTRLPDRETDLIVHCCIGTEFYRQKSISVVPLEKFQLLIMRFTLWFLKAVLGRRGSRKILVLAGCSYRTEFIYSDQLPSLRGQVIIFVSSWLVQWLCMSGKMMFPLVIVSSVCLGLWFIL